MHGSRDIGWGGRGDIRQVLLLEISLSKVTPTLFHSTQTLDVMDSTSTRARQQMRIFWVYISPLIAAGVALVLTAALLTENASSVTVRWVVIAVAIVVYGLGMYGMRRAWDSGQMAGVVDCAPNKHHNDGT